MRLLIKLAWRNGLRNRRRTFLAGLSIGIGLAGLIFTDGLMLGMSESMVRSATDTFLGQAQIQRQGFRDTMDVELTVAGGADVLRQLAREPGVRAFSPRTAAMGMITSPANVCSVVLFGVLPAEESTVSMVDEAVEQGRFLSAADPGGILLESRLAEALEVKIGSPVVVTVAQAGTGDLSQAMFRVGGIFRFTEGEAGPDMAFINISRAQEILGLGDRFHEIVVDFSDYKMAGDPGLPFWAKYAVNGNRADSWREMLPELDAALNMSGFSMLILGIILFGVVSLGILNTLFMSLYERMFEFGLLRAVGTRPSRMALMILFEAGMLAVISVVIGVFIGSAAMLIFRHYGIDYTGIEFAGVVFQEPIYPVFRLFQYTAYPALLTGFALLVGLYPALYAALLKPVEAMRKSL